jgi:hypothetical protein
MSAATASPLVRTFGARTREQAAVCYQLRVQKNLVTNRQECAWSRGSSNHGTASRIGVL